jgi:AcrR family transcriptional regulator
MRKHRGQYRGTEQRRRAILDAALACFTEVGYLDTTMEDIRRRSGASNGSIYHHFKGKEQLAAALYLEGIVDYQAGLKSELVRRAGARQGVAALVRYHLSWVRDHPDWARFLFRMRHADFMALAEQPIADANRELVTALTGFFRRHVAARRLRHLPPELYLSIVIGPCQELARYWLEKRHVDLDRAAEELGEAAWQSLRARRRGMEDHHGRAH